MKTFLMIRWVLIALMFVCGGCSLDPNWVNRYPNMITFTMCELPKGLERLQGIRYSYWVSDVFLKSCSRVQYYKQEDRAWIHGGERGTELRIEGNLDGSSDHYNMNIDQLYKLFQFGLPERKNFLNETRGERFSYSLDKTVKNNMPCIRLQTLLRTYRVESVDQKLTIFQRYWKGIEYYCWSLNDNLNNYVKINTTLLGAIRIPDEKFDRYYSHVKKINIIPEEEDEYANVPLVFKVDLEKEVLDPVFATLTIRPVAEEIKKKLDTQWRATCQSRMKIFETDYVGKNKPPENYRRMYLENCGYTVN